MPSLQPPSWKSREFDIDTTEPNLGAHAVTRTAFPGRSEKEEGGADAGRLVLLRHIAERLP